MMVAAAVVVGLRVDVVVAVVAVGGRGERNRGAAGGQ